MFGWTIDKFDYILILNIKLKFYENPNKWVIFFTTVQCLKKLAKTSCCTLFCVLNKFLFEEFSCVSILQY